MDNKQSTIREMALFAGAGGGILGGHLLGWKTVCAVEWEPYPACVLAARQNDGILPPFPIWDDVQTFDGKPWRGLVDVVSGGFPCQDISAAGKGAGIDGDRSSMWKHMARIIGEVRPRLVLVENSPLLVSRGAGLVIADLTEMGYDCQWAIISASDLGAPHQRDRFWLVAYAANARLYERRRSYDSSQDMHQLCGNVGNGIQGSRQKKDGVLGNTNDYGQITSKVGAVAIEGSDSDKTWQKQTSQSEGSGKQYAELADTSSERQQGSGQSWYSCDPAEKGEGETNNAFHERVGHIWGIKSPVGRVADGVAARMDRLKAIGNGQVPIVAATAFRILNK